MKANVSEGLLSTEQVMQLLQLQTDILETAINSHDHQMSLDSLCRVSESIVQNSLASIMLYDADKKSLNVRAAPSISKETVACLNGLVPGLFTGSCGNAVYSGKAQFVTNTKDDQRWRDITTFAEQFNIRSCWSMPISDGQGGVMGSFALSSREIRSPSIFQKNLLQTASYLATLILTKERDDLTLKKMGHSDSLTQLPNRANFEQASNKAIERARKHQEKMALLFIDLDNFKQVNDTFGHAEGDKVLCCIAQRIASKIRKGDLVARLGGDEFVVLIEELNDIDELEKIVTKLVSGLQEPIMIEGSSYGLTGSVGIALYPDNADDIPTLLHYADKAMYRAKKSGKNKYCF